MRTTTITNSERRLVTVPISETWLFENPKVLASVKQGLKESAKGKHVYRGSFAKHIKDPATSRKTRA